MNHRLTVVSPDVGTDTGMRLARVSAVEGAFVLGFVQKREILESPGLQP